MGPGRNESDQECPGMSWNIAVSLSVLKIPLRQLSGVIVTIDQIIDGQ